MKILGFFGVLTAAQEFQFDLSKLKETSARDERINRMLYVNSFAQIYARRAGNTEALTFINSFFETNDKKWNYGCWGQINDDEVQSGLGEPLDAIDRAFQNWKKCEECRNLDFGSSSMPDYILNSETSFDFNETKRFKCTSADGIYRARCQCDEALAFELVQNFGDYNSEYELENGFDFESSCKPHPKNPNNGAGAGVWCKNDGESQRQCCGDYPQRFPYDDKAGCIQCCDAASAIYNVNRHSCCGDVLGSFGCR